MPALLSCEASEAEETPIQYRKRRNIARRLAGAVTCPIRDIRRAAGDTRPDLAWLPVRQLLEKARKGMQRAETFFRDSGLPHYRARAEKISEARRAINALKERTSAVSDAEEVLENFFTLREDNFRLTAEVKKLERGNTYLKDKLSRSPVSVAGPSTAPGDWPPVPSGEKARLGWWTPSPPEGRPKPVLAPAPPSAAVAPARRWPRSSRGLPLKWPGYQAFYPLGCRGLLLGRRKEVSRLRPAPPRNLSRRRRRPGREELPRGNLGPLFDPVRRRWRVGRYRVLLPFLPSRLWRGQGQFRPP
jgi:hypothetical protein